jgi:hypothetical protein
MLTELAGLLPKEYQVYVMFDSWYASAKLINFCRRQGWQVICAIKSNRPIGVFCDQPGGTNAKDETEEGSLARPCRLGLSRLFTL